MRTLKKMGIAFLAAALLAGTGAVTSMAASNWKITSIRLDFEDNVLRGGAVDADQVVFESSADNYAITGWEFENDGIMWKDTDVPRVTVTLETGDDYYFSVSKDKIKIKGDEAKVYSTDREDSQTLRITFDLLPMSQRVGGIDYAYLQDRVATWSPAAGAASYELYLFRDDSVVGSLRVTTETTYDFGTAMLKDGLYYYRVKGVSADRKAEGPSLNSEEHNKDSNAAADAAINKQRINNSAVGTGLTKDASAGGNGAAGAIAAGVWLQDENGWRWHRADGTLVTSQMEFINSKWYIFNEYAYMVTGWVTLNGQWYFFGPEGDMWVSCQTPDGYMLDANGVRQ